MAELIDMPAGKAGALDSDSIAERRRNLLKDCSSGGNAAAARITVGPLYQVPLATAVEKGSGILTGAVGMITTSHQADASIAKGQADLVFLVREFLRDPHFPLRS